MDLQRNNGTSSAFGFSSDKLYLALLMLTLSLQSPAGVDDRKADSARKSAEQKEKLVCKREKVLGSNRTQKVCKTQSQIDAEKASAQRFGQQIRNATGVKSTLGQ